MNADHQNAQNADSLICAEEHTGMTVKRMPKTMTEAKVKEIVRVYAQEDLKVELYEGMTEELRKLDEQVAENMEQERRQIEADFEEKLETMRREMEDAMTAKFAHMLSQHHPAVEKQSKKAEKKAKGGAEAEVKGYYDVPAGVDEIARLRKINAELRKESEGKTKTNQKLQEQIATLESEDPVAKYAEEIQRLKELNQDLRKRCVAKDKTNQNLKAEILRLGGGSSAGSQDGDE
jgi:hypothetical protein